MFLILSFSGVLRAAACPRMTLALLLLSMALGPAGPSSPPVHGCVVGGSRAAHGNATTPGNKTHTSTDPSFIMFVLSRT